MITKRYSVKNLFSEWTDRSEHSFQLYGSKVGKRTKKVMRCACNSESTVHSKRTKFHLYRKGRGELYELFGVLSSRFRTMLHAEIINISSDNYCKERCLRREHLVQIGSSLNVLHRKFRKKRSRKNRRCHLSQAEHDSGISESQKRMRDEKHSAALRKKRDLADLTLF